MPELLLRFANLLLSLLIFVFSYFSFLIFRDFSEELTSHISKHARIELKEELFFLFHALKIIAIGFFFFALRQAAGILGDFFPAFPIPSYVGEILELIALGIMFYGIAWFALNLMKLKRSSGKKSRNGKRRK